MEKTNKNREILFEKIVKSTNDNRIKLIEATIEFFDQHKISVDIDHYEFYLILDEAISNAMEHGNKWLLEKRVNLKVFKPDHSKVEICIADEGEGFNPGGVPQNLNGTNTLAPRGRGIIIIKKFCEVQWNNSGNSIRLFLNLG